MDAIREEIVTSTTVYVGENGNFLEEKRTTAKYPRRSTIRS
ncbi:MAG: glutamate synthase central domain-containing protein [Lachnospiraceae bacterium]